MDDALVLAAEREERHSELRAVLAQRLDLGARDRVGDGLVDVDRGDVVILGREGEIGAAYDASRRAQRIECLGARDLVHEVEVDVEEVGFTFRTAHHVRVPDLLRQRLAHVHSLGGGARVTRQKERPDPGIGPSCETRVSLA